MRDRMGRGIPGRFLGKTALLAVLGLPGAVRAAPATGPDPAPATPPPATAQHATAAASALRATLPNGLRVVIVPDRLAPVVSTEINYLAGSNDAPPGFPGTAHATEHMMFRGSEGLDKDQLAEIGSKLGGAYNADTTETVTQYYYTAPADDLAVVLHVEALRMNRLTLDQTDWDTERGAIEQEVSRDLSSPAYNYLSQLQATMFAGTPYEHDALGTRPSFDRTNATLLRAFWQRWYAPNNAILVIAGDVDPDRALADVKAAFGAIQPKPLPPHPTFTLRPVTPRTLSLPTDYPASPRSPTGCRARGRGTSPPPTCWATCCPASAARSTRWYRPATRWRRSSCTGPSRTSATAWCSRPSPRAPTARRCWPSCAR